MNKLVLIGNGFDLAHGLKTSYSDFLVWYLNKVITEFGSSGRYEDSLVVFKPSSVSYKEAINNIEDFVRYKRISSEMGISVNFRHKFFKEIIENAENYNWVDIEYKYYTELLTLYRILEKNDQDESSYVTGELLKLNHCFRSIKKELIKYLETIKTESAYKLEIESHFKKYLRIQDSPRRISTVYFLTFNYTSTIENYMKIFSNKRIKIETVVNFIHGKMKDLTNPIVFGYGDEMDIYYNKIERLNDNRFLENIKSFSYFKTNNYKKFSDFLMSGHFNVYIFGHSCGISDRILLNSIFEHKNCELIRIFYYKKDDSYNDYFEKTQEISRHFKAENKGKMRNVIIPFDESCPMTGK